MNTEQFEKINIWIADGLYLPGPNDGELELDGRVSIYGGFEGDETSLEDRDPEAPPAIISFDRDQDDDPSDLTTFEDNADGSIIDVTGNEDFVITVDRLTLESTFGAPAIDTRYFSSAYADTSLPQPYRWTRGGLEGIDVGADEINTSGWCD